MKPARSPGTIPLRADGLVADPRLLAVCRAGGFYLTRESGGARLTLRASGRTALFVAEGITVHAVLDVQGRGGRAERSVRRRRRQSARHRAPRRSRPAERLRIYADAGGTIALSAGSRLAGDLYAPAADLASSAPQEVFGSLLVNHLVAEGGLTLHLLGGRRLPALTDVGETAPAPPAAATVIAPARDDLPSIALSMCRSAAGGGFARRPAATKRLSPFGDCEGSHPLYDDGLRPGRLLKPEARGLKHATEPQNCQ